jgi:hypothetical protein
MGELGALFDSAGMDDDSDEDALLWTVHESAVRNVTVEAVLRRLFQLRHAPVTVLSGYFTSVDDVEHVARNLRRNFAAYNAELLHLAYLREYNVHAESSLVVRFYVMALCNMMVSWLDLQTAVQNTDGVQQGTVLFTGRWCITRVFIPLE